MISCARFRVDDDVSPAQPNSLEIDGFHFERHFFIYVAKIAIDGEISPNVFSIHNQSIEC